MDKFKLTNGKQLVRTREVLFYFQAPRFSATEMNEIKEPKQGMIIYNTTTNKLNFYTGTSWEAITSS